MKEEFSNKKAFIILLEEHQGILHKISRAYTNNHNDQEDLFQEICFQLWKSWPLFREDCRFSTWMYRVALNTAISFIRKENRAMRHESLHEHQITADDQDDHREEVSLLFKAIGKLNRTDKALVLLWLDEMRYEEIASVLGISKSNVSVKLVRIKRELALFINGLMNTWS